MGKVIFIFLFVFILIIPLIHAIKISEVESNPPGKDSGNEWVEFFSKNYTNGTGYLIRNNDGQEILLNFSFQGYYTYTFKTQWLDNKDEKISFYKNGILLDSTPIFNDTQDNSLDLSNCKNGWKFLESSKGKINNCPVEVLLEKNKAQDNETQSIQIIENQSGSKNGLNVSKTLLEGEDKLDSHSKKLKPKIIILNSQVIKSKETNSNLKSKWFVKYSFVIFCIFILSLFILKRKKLKNEWNN